MSGDLDEISTAIGGLQADARVAREDRAEIKRELVCIRGSLAELHAQRQWRLGFLAGLAATAGGAGAALVEGLRALLKP